jgi:phosphoribosyl 1,2-cyclic phosphodiesterase
MPHSSPHLPFRVRVLRSGSAGNAVLIEAGTTRVLVDAGLPAEAILRDLPDGGLTAILATHEHDDHLRGAASAARATGAVVLTNEATLRAAAPQLAGAPVEVFRTGWSFRAGTVEVTPFPVSHDAAEPVGFVVEWRGMKVAVACDLGEVTELLVEHTRGVDLFLVEANYDLRLMAVSAYPWFLKNRIVGTQGHLSNDGAARAAVEACRGGTRAVALIHLSEVNNLAPLARDVVRGALDAEGLDSASVEAVRPNAGGPWWAVAPDSGTVPTEVAFDPAHAAR